MPTFRKGAGLDLHFETDDFTDPWRAAEAVLMLHGNSESGRAWYAWVPRLGREYRLIRPDMRGFGRSTPMPEDHDWSMDEVVGDYIALLDHLGEARVHVVGAKISAFVGIRMAASHPERIRSLTLVGPPPSITTLAATVPSVRLVAEEGVEGWARKNMVSRLGAKMPPEAIAWWSRYMGQTAASTQIGFMRKLAAFDATDDLDRVKAPMLVIVPESIAAEVQGWQHRVAGSKLLTVQGDSYHIAVSDADMCAGNALAFIRGNPL